MNEGWEEKGRGKCKVIKIENLSSTRMALKLIRRNGGWHGIACASIVVARVRGVDLVIAHSYTYSKAIA